MLLLFPRLESAGGWVWMFCPPLTSKRSQAGDWVNKTNEGAGNLTPGTLLASCQHYSSTIVSTIVSTSTIVNSQHPPRFNRGSWRRHPRSTCLRHLTNQPINFSAVNWTLKPKSTTQNTTWSSKSNTQVSSRIYPYPVCLLSLLGIQIGFCIAKRSSELINCKR